MIKNINTILDWFKAGKKPTEQQFADSWQSFWHKEEIIPQAAVEDLETDLDLKADRADLESIVSDIGACVPYTGATGNVDLGIDHRLGAGYVGGGYGDGTSVPASLAARNPFVPATGATSTVFGVYNSTGIRSLYVYTDDQNNHHVNNRGRGSVASNSAFGVFALNSNTTGSLNVAHGYYALTNNLTGYRNTAIGSQSLRNHVIGIANTAVGNSALQSLNNPTTSLSWNGFNTAIGDLALNALTTGVANTSLGWYTGSSTLSTGHANTLLGNRMGAGLISGSCNLMVAAVPYAAGSLPKLNTESGVTTGNYNVFIGGVFGMAENDSKWVVIADNQGDRAFEKNGATGAVNIVGSSLLFNGSSISNLLSLKSYAIKIADYTLTATDETVDFTDKTTAKATLLTAIGNTGKKFTIKNSGTGVITLGTTLSQTIDGAATFIIRSQYAAVTVQSDGANWKIISVYGL